MTTSKLLVLVSALLLATAGHALADEPATVETAEAAPAEGEVATEPLAPPDDEAPTVAPQAGEDSWVAVPADAAEGMVEVVPAAMPEASDTGLATNNDAAEMPDSVVEVADPVVGEMPASVAGVADPASAEMVDPVSARVLDSEPAEVPAVAEETMALGQVGYDEQGREGRIHLVIGGDTLWDISDAYLGTPWVWPSIWQDNQVIENPHRIYPGDRIWITPWEMRKLTAAEAQALLAGSPAAPDPEPLLATEEPAQGEVAPALGGVREEQPTVYVANREMVGLVTAETVEAAASVVSAVVKDKVMLSQDDRVWIGMGEDDVENGDQFTIFRVQEKVYDPETGRMLGYHVNILGWLEVTDVHSETASSVIRESALDIEIGDRIMPRKPAAKEIAIQPSPDDVDGQISFMAQQRTLAGTLQYVYLNRGTLDGVEVGSPLQVYRRSFRAREDVRGENVRVPQRVVADLLVVKSEPEVSVALIRHTAEELALGDHFRGRSSD
jgi:nucleoid-associated protein YgaU